MSIEVLISTAVALILYVVILNWLFLGPSFSDADQAVRAVETIRAILEATPEAPR